VRGAIISLLGARALETRSFERIGGLMQEVALQL
jgi:hypothetical protein